MDGYCRLCAKTKSATALKHKFSDLISKITECCRWLEPSIESEYPQNVCGPCAKRLDQSWKFAEAVSSAQKELDDIIAQQRAEVVLVRDEYAKEVKVEPDALSGNALAMDEIEPTKTEFYDFINNTEDSSDFEWPDNNVDDCDATHEGDDDDNYDEGGGGVSDVKDAPENGSTSTGEHDQNTLIKSDFSNTLEGKLAKTRRKEFLDRINANARLDNGRIHPDEITELRLCDWSVFEYQCSVCSALFKTSDCLRKHFSDSHSSETIQWICSICSREPVKFKDLWQLHVHVANHHYPHLIFW